MLLATFYSVGSKIDKITRIFDDVEDIKTGGLSGQRMGQQLPG